MSAALIYARVSSQEQLQGWSIGTQLEACRAYAAQHGYTVAAESYDAETGATTDRPGWQATMRALRAGQAGALIVYQTDRLHRDLIHALTTRRELKALGIELHSVRRGKSGDTPEAEFTDAIDDLVAEMERKRIAERTTRGKRGKAMSGQMVGNGPAPYGYLYVGQGRQRHLEIDATTAPTVRQIFQWYAWGDDDGPVAVGEIARRLHGLPTPAERGGDASQWRKQRAPGVWAPSHVYPILHNTVYSGRFEAFRLKRMGTKSRERPEHERIIVPTPALIDAATWEAAQRRIAAGRQQSPRQAKYEYLLGRRVTCACGFGAHGRASSDRPNGRRLWYVCNGRMKTTAGDCTAGLPWLRAEPVDAAVWGYLAAALETDEALEQAFVDGRETTPDAVALGLREELTRRRARFERQKTTLLDMLLADELDRPTWRQRTAVVDEQIAAITAQLAGLPEAPPEPAADTQDAIRVFAERVRPLLHDMTFAARRRVVEALDVWVTLKPDKTIEIRSGFGVASVSIV